MRAVGKIFRLVTSDSGIQWVYVKNVTPNKAFAHSGHMVQNRPYWVAIYVVGDRGQSNSHQAFLSLHIPLGSLWPSIVRYLYLVIGRAKALLR